VDEVGIFAFQIGYSFAIFILISLGLAVIFGMMRVINLAQGEFIMLGAYVCLFATKAGIDLWLAMLLSAVAVGIFGAVVERLLIRWLYGRIIDTLLATWGLSMLLVGGVTTAFGPQGEGVESGLSAVQMGIYRISQYDLVLIAIAVALLIGVTCLWRFTRFGLIVRGTMQNAQMAGSLGVNTGLVYTATFAFGSAITGLAGAAIAPIAGIAPTMGIIYVAKAFIAVISGGHFPLMGTMTASALFGTIDGTVGFITTTVIAQITVLLSAILLLQLLPLGITGRFKKGF
jgi:branched-chain amino acid transport system permease protein